MLMWMLQGIIQWVPATTLPILIIGLTRPTSALVKIANPLIKQTIRTLAPPNTLKNQEAHWECWRVEDCQRVNATWLQSSSTCFHQNRKVDSQRHQRSISRACKTWLTEHILTLSTWRRKTNRWKSKGLLKLIEQRASLSSIRNTESYKCKRC